MAAIQTFRDSQGGPIGFRIVGLGLFWFGLRFGLRIQSKNFNLRIRIGPFLRSDWNSDRGFQEIIGFGISVNFFRKRRIAILLGDFFVKIEKISPVAGIYHCVNIFWEFRTLDTISRHLKTLYDLRWREFLVGGRNGGTEKTRTNSFRQSPGTGKSPTPHT